MYRHISYDDLVEFGLSESYIRVALNRFRNLKSKSWSNVHDLDDKRRVWIELDTIPTKTREKYNIPTAAEYEAQKEALLQKALELENKVKYNKDTKNLLNAYQGKWSQYSETYHKRLEYSTKQQEKYAIRYAQEHAFWVQMIEVSGGKYKASYGKISECFNMYCTLKQKHINFISEIKSCNHFRVKLKAIREANLKGIQYMVDEIVDNGKKARPNQIKVNDFHTSLMVMYLSYGQKYSYRVVTDLINHLCEFQGFETISESSVKSKMYNDNKLRTIIEKNRHGKKYASDNILPYAVRNVTPFPGNVWMIDGTPIQFICWNESRTKQIRLNLFVIIDVCSRKVVGMDISYSEDRYNIMNALKMAISNEGHLPYEIVSDNFSASKTEEIKELKLQMGKLGVNWRHSKVGNAQDKSYVERFFGTFQTVECALHEGYLGEGITSKRNNRPSPEILAKAKKDGILTYKEMKSKVASMIGKYNERALGNRKSPINIYKNTAKPNIVEMDAVRTSLLFWKKTSYTVKRGMVKITIQKVMHHYEIHDHDLKMQLQNIKVTVRYDETDLSWIMLFDYDTDRPICECKKHINVVMTDIDGAEDDKSIQIAAAKRKSYETHIEKERQKVIDKGLEYAGVDELELAHPLSLKKNQIHTAESKAFINYFNNEHRIAPEVENLVKVKHPFWFKVSSVNEVVVIDSFMD